jgi:hypothetical protein
MTVIRRIAWLRLHGGFVNGYRSLRRSLAPFPVLLAVPGQFLSFARGPSGGVKSSLDQNAERVRWRRQIGVSGLFPAHIGPLLLLAASMNQHSACRKTDVPPQGSVQAFAGYAVGAQFGNDKLPFPRATDGIPRASALRREWNHLQALSGPADLGLIRSQARWPDLNRAASSGLSLN